MWGQARADETTISPIETKQELSLCRHGSKGQLPLRLDISPTRTHAPSRLWTTATDQKAVISSLLQDGNLQVSPHE